MKTLVAMVFALAATTSAASAAEPSVKPDTPAPTKLTAAQLDKITAGALVQIDVQNVLNHNNVDVSVPVTVKDVNVSVAAAVAVLGAAGAASGILN